MKSTFRVCSPAVFRCSFSGCLRVMVGLVMVMTRASGGRHLLATQELAAGWATAEVETETGEKLVIACCPEHVQVVEALMQSGGKVGEA